MSARRRASARPKACLPPPEPGAARPAGRRAALFSIAPHLAFADVLVRGLLARIGDDPLALARVQILLPNRRAVRTLTDAFVRLAGDRGVLLPRMTPVGDLGDDSFERFAAGTAALPPAVSPLLRRLELARLVRAMPGDRSAVEAVRLGDALGATLDALLAEEIDPERLRAVVADTDLAAHWQATLAFLDLVISHWPPARAAAGASDHGTRVAALIDALVARWAAAPPATPVIAAGITGSSPPLVRLLRGVAALPAGAIVLPGLDTDLSEAGEARWTAIACAAALADDGAPAPRDSEEHPQFAMKALLARLGVDRAEVDDWHAADTGPAARTPLVMAAMAPADAADGWHSAIPAAGFDGVTAGDAAPPSEEAHVIALALREALATPGRTAALVTPDRGLARRVAAHCRRWGIMIDDSGGTPLALTPPGTLAQALVAALAQGFAPVPLLALLQHPLAASGDGRLAWLDKVRRLDRVLRGVRPPPGLEAIAEAIDRAIAEKRCDADLADWWEGAADRLAPLAALAERREIDLPRLAAALRTAGTSLAADALWAGVAGRALAALAEALEAGGTVFGGFETDEAPALLAALMGDIAVRPAYGGHPRLAILGPLEARLQTADLMILGGLNEGSWPGRPAPDPWLAPAIRARLGLPDLARATGLAAHDFVSALGAPRVLLTRARRDASAPMVPSRFWLRIDAFSGGIGRDDRLLRLARRLDGGGAVPAEKPMPCPPLGRRPRSLGVTEVDSLVTDPFAFYAKRLLRLAPLDPLDQDPTAATRGNRIHEVLEDWIKGGGGSLERLDRLANAMLDSEGRHFPLLRALWAPRARRALRWAGEEIHRREADGWRPDAAEAAGTLTLPNGITLKGRADRVDRHDDNRLAVIDYKTGRAPSAAQVKAGLANQLGLLLAMAAGGSLASDDGRIVVRGTPAAIAYWQLGGGNTPGKAIDPLAGKDRVEAGAHVDFVLDHVEAVTTRLLLRFSAFEPKLHPGLAWGDYDHLARVAEWQDRPKRRGRA